MAQAKKSPRGNNRKRTAAAKPSGGRWVLLILAIVVVAAVAVASHFWAARQTTESGQQDARSVKQQRPGQSTKPAQKFEFYTLLPKQSNGPEVKSPQQQKAGPASESNGTSGTETKSTIQYMIQAGSFATRSEADQRKAEVAMLGFSSAIQPAQVHGKTYYRVQIGPVAVERVGSVKKRLHDAKIESLATRMH